MWKWPTLSPCELDWSAVEPHPASGAATEAEERRCPRYWRGGPPPLQCEVRSGETLYLPATWFHYVRQRRCEATGRPALAVNYWYDMQFDSRFAHTRFVEEAFRRFGGAV